MRIIFVAGPAFSGKSIYIRKELPGAAVINVSTFYKNAFGADSNEEIDTIGRNAQLYCKEGLQNCIKSAKEDDMIVLEHHLLRKEIRRFFIDAVREVTDAPIECIVMEPSEEMVAKMLNNEQQLIHFHEYEKSKLEMPDTSEGFESVRTVCPVFSEEDCQRL